MTAAETTTTTPAMLMLPTDQLTLGLDFRLDEDADDLADLAASIGALGVLQALTVRQTTHGWEVVAGRRRLAAARIAGLEHVPCVLRQLTDNEAADAALAENLHRRDLSPVEIALALQRLRYDEGLAVADIATRIGRSAATVYVLLQVLTLPDALRSRVHRRELNVKTALDLNGRRSYTKKAPGSKGAPPADGLTAMETTYWRRRHDRVVAGLQRLRRARADGLNISQVLTMVDQLIDLDQKPLPDETKP